MFVMRQADMFYMSWNGQDMMKYVYRSLDFLHQCPLLVKWFGTGKSLLHNYSRCS